MTLGRYALIVVAIVVGTLAVLWPLLPLGGRERSATVFGAGLAAVNALLAYSLVLWSRNRSTKAFLGAVLGGMIGRMAVLLAAVAAAVALLDLPSLPLALSLLGYFVVLLALELAVVHRQTAPAREPK